MNLISSIGDWFKSAFKSFAPMDLDQVNPQSYYGGFNDYGASNYYLGSDGSKYPGGLSSTGVSPILNNFFIRQNARSAYHDTPIAKGIVDRFADTVVDRGLMLESTPVANILGITPERAKDWSLDVQERFHIWAKEKKCHRAELMNFYQMQRLAEIFQQRDNDYFVRLYYSNSPRLLNPLQIDFLDPNQIRGDVFTSTYGYQQTHEFGIERDEAGREIRYRVSIKVGKTYKQVTVPAAGPKSLRRFMLHGFSQEYAGQLRGVSRLGHILQEFENLTDFSLAQIKKAINQSNIAVWVEPSEENAASNPVEEITHQGVGPASQLLGANPSAAPPGTLPLDQVVKYIPLPEAAFAKPGSAAIFSLQEGEKLKEFGQTSPSAEYDRFVDSFVSHLASSVGMPLEILLLKFEQNYSASRAALIMFWRIAQIWRDELAADFMNPTYEMWLAGEIAAGRIQAVGWLDPRMRSAWLCNNWVGAPIPNIDPMKTARADRTYVEMGAQTLDGVARNLNGSSGSANRAQLAREYAELPTPPWEIKKPPGRQ